MIVNLSLKSILVERNLSKTGLKSVVLKFLSTMNCSVKRKLKSDEIDSNPDNDTIEEVINKINILFNISKLKFGFLF